MKKVSIERLIVDVGSDCVYSLGTRPDHEFKFEFIIRDEIADVSILIDHDSTCVAHSSSASWYEITTTGVIIEGILYDSFVEVLESIKKNKEKEIFFIQRS